jgi:outer membrane protein
MSNKLGENIMTMFRINFLAIPIFIFQIISARAVYADQNKTLYLTLEKSIEICLAENRQLKASYSRIARADQELKQTRCDFLPKFSMTYGYKKTDEPESIDLDLPRLGTVSIDISSTENFKWTGAITQPLFKGFGTMGRYRWASLAVDRAKVDAALEKLDMILRTKQAYFDVLATDKAVQVAQQAARALSAHVEDAQGYYELEMIAVNDLLKAKVQLSNTEYELIKAINASKQARTVFTTLLALPINMPITLEDILIYAPMEKQYDAYIVQALRQRPEIESIQIELRQIDQQIIIERSRMYPDIDMQYRYIQEGDTFNVSGSQFHDPNRWEISAVLSWTIWEWGKTRYAISENRCKRDELQHLMAAFEDNIRLEVKTALLKLEQADKNVPKAAQSVEQGKENLRVSQERFDAQAAASTEVLDAQTLLTQAELNYYSAIYDHNLAKANLERALGIH